MPELLCPVCGTSDDFGYVCTPGKFGMRGGESSALCGCRKSMTASLEISNCELCPQDQSRSLLGLSTIYLRMVCASLSESATAFALNATNPDTGPTNVETSSWGNRNNQLQPPPRSKKSLTTKKLPPLEEFP